MFIITEDENSDIGIVLYNIHTTDNSDGDNNYDADNLSNNIFDNNSVIKM